MKNWFFLVFAIAGFKVWGQASENFYEYINFEKRDSILEIVDRFPAGTEISIAIISGGEPIFFGLRKSRDTIKAVENYQSAFEIGSITKVFTATVLANFVEEGTIRLNDDVADYLGYETENELSISFKQLSNHTSGLPRLPDNFSNWVKDFRNPYKHYGEEALKEYFKDYISIKKEDQNKYAYSNLAVGLLGQALSKIKNQELESLYQTLIFSKNNMKNSTVRRETLKTRLVDGNGALNWDLGALEGAGAILSTTQDLSNFAKAQFDPNNTAMKMTREKTFEISENTAIGLGWHLSYSDEKNLVRHGGGTGGYRSFMALDVLKKNGIIVLSNVSAQSANASSIGDIAMKLWP
ncbi:MAG: class A beta-lactamase-related serine hydrolase [Allomuricauda sp.]|nr:MAG: class A beta-lactamase-related serine hydrolase [Allomuricauda sp.]